MGHTALVLGDQLSHDNPALEGADRVLLIESRRALGRLRYHRRRRHLVLSAMRHFAAERRERGEAEVIERRDEPDMAGVLQDFGDVVCAAPHSAPGRRALQAAGVRFVTGTQFLTDPDDFAAWAGGRKRLVMEDFYREQRRRFGLLLEDGEEPAGGRWNFDAENRRPPREGLDAPAPYTPREDEIDEEVRRDLDAMELPEFGEDGPREWPATATEAKRALEDFVGRRLADFGPWQDAMVSGQPWLFHAKLSAPMNLGLLAPLDACRAAEAAWRVGDAPLASVEGFVRQIIGWREYVWGMYWYRERDWRRGNALRAQRALPAAFWTGKTDAECLRATLADVRERAYAHHIQRLMVLGNTLLLTGVKPWEAVEWFHAAFIDGAEWVMAPNAAGMSLWADGGRMMTKPYAAGGNYINRMSTYCGDCRYDPKQRTGEDACPFTASYWDFMDRHAERFEGNRRMSLPLRNLRGIDAGELDAIKRRARAFRRELS